MSVRVVKGSGEGEWEKGLGRERGLRKASGEGCIIIYEKKHGTDKSLFLAGVVDGGDV